MNTRLLCLAFIAANTLAVSAMAQDSQTADASQAETAAFTEVSESKPSERDDEAIVCRDLAPKVGTRLPGRRVCLPVHQWEEWEKTTRETSTDIEMRGRIRNN